MTRRKKLVGIGLCGVMLVVAAACGQKPGVADQGAPAAAFGLGALPSGATVDANGNIVDANGNVIGSSSGGITGGGGTGSLSGGSSGGVASGSSGGAGSTGGSGSTNSGSGGTGSTAGDTTGVTNDTITIGIHAPITGAAPVPSSSLDKGKDLYFRWKADHGESIFGRTVKVVLKNDNYNPSQAVSVCKEMVEQDHVFLLIGAAGTDQIQACAKYAASVGVPYLSNGVTEVGLTNLPNYFALSMTYPQQGPLLAQEIMHQLKGKTRMNGMVRFDTPNFEDAHQAFINAMKQLGGKVPYDKAVPKEANDTDAAALITDMKANGVQNAYVLTSPTFFLQMLKAADQQQYHPQWLGVGLTMTFDVVAQIGCNNLDGARFFSPFPAWSDRNKFDPDFDKAYQKYYSGNSDDFEFSEWSLGAFLWKALALPGKNLTRQGFVSSLEKAGPIQTGIGPTDDFSPTDHFGANAVHLDQTTCSDSKWHTLQSFATHF